MPDATPSADLLAESSVVTIAAGDGAKARVHLNGAHVTSWSPAGSSDDRLFVSAKSGFGPGVSIRGGIPVCFPQFGTDGPLPQHGFARTAVWTLISVTEGEDAAQAMLRLTHTDATLAMWPHTFVAELTVSIGGSTLDVALAVTNTSDSAMQFTAALHPYFRVADAYTCEVAGLSGLTYRDSHRNRERFTEGGESLDIRGAIDRVYFNAPQQVWLREPERALLIERRGFSDIVVWNPGAEGVSQRQDFHEGDERRFVCVEGAAVGHPVHIAPGAIWTGVQRITATE